MAFLVLVLHILVTIFLVGLVLLQHGKGADMGAAFGSGASGGVFGASGSANFLSRATAVLAALFFATSMALAYFSSLKPETHSISNVVPVQSQPLPVQQESNKLNAIPK